MKTPVLIVALDVDNLDDALRLREELDGVVDYFKVGKELFTAVGPEILRRLQDHHLFLDLKFHDIPNTVAGAVRAAGRFGVDLLDVHVAGGRAMMQAAMAAAGGSKGEQRPSVFGVTVLTHLGDDDLGELGFQGTAVELVARMARLAAGCGLDGVVASAREIACVREATGDALSILVPGLRPSWASGPDDQKRTATPDEAARAGASYVVIGRAITRQPRPADAAKRILDELDVAGGS